MEGSSRGGARDHGRSRGTRDDRRRSRSRSPANHSRRRERSRSRSPRRRSRSPRRRLSPGRSRSTSRSGRRDRQERARGRSTSRSRSRSKDGRRDRSRERERRRRSRSVSSSSSSSSDHIRHKKKDKHKKRRSRSRDKDKDKDRKEKKKSKKDKKKHKSGAVGHHQWGKYGLINETDLYNKEQEFRAWLVEERKVNPETISKDQTKKEFARFVEDYNTATLPHEKFYHMEEYERRMSAMRAGEYVPPQDDSYDPTADMRAHESTHKRRVIEHETYMSKDQLMELRRVQNERIQAGKMKQLGMEIKQTMGVRMDGTMFDG